MTDPDTPPANDAEQLPRHTTPTWEVELLISGAAVFAMLQLPGWLNEHLLPLIPRFAEGSRMLLFVSYAYIASAAIILAITFALHLVLRAHWIALVGMHSVFPEGVRWQRLRLGPLQRGIIKQHDRGGAQAIERADNRATTVFAFGVMMALSILWLSLAASIAFVITMAIGPAHHGIVVAVGFVYLLLLAISVQAVAKYVDIRLGHRLRAGSIPQRLLSGLFEALARTGLLRGYSVSRVLESHIGPRRFKWLTIAVTAPVVLAVAMNFSHWGTPSWLGNYAGFPHFTSTSPHQLQSAHYNDERNILRDPSVPYIQSEIVTGPYLKLVVPYSPTRDADSLRRQCPAIKTAHTFNASALARLDCLSAWHTATLDGKALTALHYAVANDPRTNRPALQAMIDVRALAPGRHELRVTRAPAPPGRHDHDKAKAKAWIIPFWR